MCKANDSIITKVSDLMELRKMIESLQTEAEALTDEIKAYMGEEEKTQYSGDRSQKYAARQYIPVSRGQKQHRQVDHKENQGAAEVPREHQDAHMDKSRCCQERQVRRFILLAERARHEQYEQYFDKFAGLERHPRDREAELGAVGDRPKKQHRAQGGDPQDPVNIGSLSKRIKFVSQ